MRGPKGWRGIAAGGLGLAVLDAFLTRKGAVNAAGGAFAGITKFVSDFISPAVPAFSASVTSSAATSTASTANATVPGAGGAAQQPSPSTSPTTVPGQVGTINGQPVQVA